MLDGPEILYVDRARSFRRGQGQAGPDLRTGSRLPAYCTAMGKLLLANLPEADQRELIASIKLTKSGPNTITTKKALRDELDEVLDANFAVDDEELAKGLYSIAAPVRDEARDVVAAVDIAVPSSMISIERARRRARAAPHLHRRPHLRAPGLPPRRRAELSARTSGARWAEVRPLPGRVAYSLRPVCRPLSSAPPCSPAPCCS